MYHRNIFNIRNYGMLNPGHTTEQQTNTLSLRRFQRHSKPMKKNSLHTDTNQQDRVIALVWEAMLSFLLVVVFCT